MSNYAILDINDIIINIISWDGIDQSILPINTSAVLLSDNDIACIGYKINESPLVQDLN